MVPLVLAFLELRDQRGVSMSRGGRHALVARHPCRVLLAQGVQGIGVAEPPVAFVIVYREIGSELHFRFVEQAGFQSFIGKSKAGERIARLLGCHSAQCGEAISHVRGAVEWREVA